MMAQDIRKPPGIIIPLSFKKTINKLSNDDTGIFLKALLKYADTGEVLETDNIALDFLFEQGKDNIDKYFIKYGETCEKNRKNALKRWDKNEVDATACDRIPSHTSACHRMPSDANINKNKIKLNKIKNKIKSKNKTKIKNTNKNKKEKNITMCAHSNTKKEKSATAQPQSHNFNFTYISSLGHEMGIDELYCRKFYDYYNDIGWVTAKGEPIKNVKMLLRIWYNKDKTKNKNEIKKVDRGDAKDEARRIFGNF